MRPSILLPVVAVLVLLFGACSADSSPAPRETPAPGAPTTAAPPTAALPPSTTTTVVAEDASPAPGQAIPAEGWVDPVREAEYPNYRLTEEFAAGLEIDVHAPAEPGPWPVVVTVHGGGWFIGERDSMSRLADGLAGEGVVAFNASYRTIALGGRFPTSVDDVACAVAYAREHAARFTTTPGPVVVVGHSAGAHLGALVALAPGQFGEGCTADVSGGADGLVGLAGPYDTDRLAFLLAPFFGTKLEEDPAPWARGNPLRWVESSPDVPVLLLHGDADEVVPVAFSEDLSKALVALGKRAVLEVLPGVDHVAVTDPEVVAPLIAEFLSAP